MLSLQPQLLKLGFSKEESAIYLTCLTSGSLPVSVISRNTNIGRINCYHHIEKLIEKEFLLEEKKSGVKHFFAENPQIIINKQKEKINIAQNILPEMLAIASTTPQKPKIQFFEGTEGIKKILEKMLQFPNSEIVSFSNFKSLRYISKEYIQKHFRQRATHKIKTRFITPDSKEAQEFQNTVINNLKDLHLSETFFIASKEFYFSSEISIFSGNVAIFSISKNNIQGVLIENPEIYQTQKAIFDLAWLGATSFIT